MKKRADLIYYQRNQDVILKRAKDYYKNDKKRLWEQAKDKYRNLSEEEKNKKNMGRIDIAICLKKRNKDSENINKIIMREKKSQYNNE